MNKKPWTSTSLIPVFQCLSCKKWIFMEVRHEFQKYCTLREYCPECLLGIGKLKYIDSGISFYEQVMTEKPINEIDLFIRMFSRDRLKVLYNMREELNHG